MMYLFENMISLTFYSFNSNLSRFNHLTANIKFFLEKISQNLKFEFCLSYDDMMYD